MKTSKFAIALDRDNLDDSKAQACGLVSSIIVRSEGVGPGST